MKSIKKDQKFKHLILFDSSCSLCQKAVKNILSADKKKLFVFSSLKGKSSEIYLKKDQKQFLKKNTLILLENYTSNPLVSIRSKAIFRICSKLGGYFRFLGIFAYIPIIFDPLYILIARHRHKYKKCSKLTFSDDRFIP